VKVTIYHNPKCGTSRNVLAMIRAAGIEPEIVRYLDEPLPREAVKALFAATGQPVRALLRRNGTPYDELGLDDPALTDEALIDAVVRHPILMNRPIVSTGLGTALCRPSETVAKLLPAGALPQIHAKEDGEIVSFAANEDGK
jgi:arsenate reductase